MSASYADATADAVRVLDAGADPFTRESLESLAAHFGSPLFVIDAERVRAQYRSLQAALPGVDLHYALKPLPHAAVVATLRDEGAWFDLATTGEVDVVRRLDVPASRCIHTHPIKREIDIRNALAYGVPYFVADNPDEILKFAKFKNRASLLIRVCFRSTGAVCDLSKKFGCEPDAAEELLTLAARLAIRVAGFSFHAGSQLADPHMHVQAIEVCNRLIRSSGAGHELRVLDIGGGFPVPYRTPVPEIGDFCAPIRAALEKLPPGMRVIAEPGRFIAAPSAVALSTVMGRAKREGRWWYYLDDGVYSSYSGVLYDHAKFPVEPLVDAAPLQPSVLTGPTCDSIDVIDDHIDLPELDIGDRLAGRMMGAYTWASASEFNFFPKATVIALDRGVWLQSA